MDVKEQRVKVFLLWRSKRSEQPAPESVSRALLDRFAPLFDRSPTPFHRTFSGANLAGFEIPLDGWNADLEQEDRDRWVMSIDPPINARAALGRVGLSSQPSDVLLTLAEALENDPRPLVGELAPPTSLLWENRRTDDLRLQTDGLGHAQLFEYDDDDFTVITNRIHALSCLGIELKPVAEEWAARFTIGWFPLSTTGFRDVQTLRGGTQLCFGKKGVTRDVHSVLNDWVHPEPMSRDDALELGTASLETMCDEAMAQWTRPSVGLSGGYGQPSDRVDPAQPRRRSRLESARAPGTTRRADRQPFGENRRSTAADQAPRGNGLPRRSRTSAPASVELSCGREVRSTSRNT